MYIFRFFAELQYITLLKLLSQKFSLKAFDSKEQLKNQILFISKFCESIKLERSFSVSLKTIGKFFVEAKKICVYFQKLF